MRLARHLRRKTVTCPPLSIIPLHLPEFSTKFRWATCRNCMCANFGVPYTGDIPLHVKKLSGGTHIRRTQMIEIGKLGHSCLSC